MEVGSFEISRSTEDTMKQYQAYLRKYENDEKLVILKAVDKPGSKLGDNYTSVLIRKKLVGTRGDGSPYAKSFMVKMFSEDRPAAGILGLSTLFDNEGYVYHKILPLLGPFGPDCIHFDEKTIIMEDLAEKGYVNCDRREFLDLEHVVLSLKTLAKMHASGLSLKIKDPRLFDEIAAPLKEAVYKKEPTAHMRACFQLSSKTSLQCLEMIKPRTQEMQAIIDLFEKYFDNAYDTFSRMFHEPKQKYDTICHGDPWMNNILFLHDNNGKVIDLKMVDYQISRHTSVATDVHYLIYTSARSSVIERSYESLIKIYHHALLDELRRLRVDEKILAELGPEWLEAELRTYMKYGPIMGCWLVHALLADEEDAANFEKLDIEHFDLGQAKMSKQKLDRIECLVTHHYRRFYLGIVNDDLEPIPITG